MAKSETSLQIGKIISARGAKLTALILSPEPGKPDAGEFCEIGSLVKAVAPDSLVFGLISALELQNPQAPAGNRLRLAHIDLLGESLDADQTQDFTFQRGVSSYPLLEAGLFTCTSQDLARVFAKPSAANACIGSIHQDANLPAHVLTDELLGKHFAVLGTSGSGKSCTVAVILRSILESLPCGHIVVLDPHDEYGHAFADLAVVLNPGDLELPYWFLNFEETVEVLCSSDLFNRQIEAAILKQAIIAAKHEYQIRLGRDFALTVDTPAPYRLSRLLELLSEGMGKLNKPESTLPYMRLTARIESLREDRRFAFMFSGLTVEDSMGTVLRSILRLPCEGKPMTVINISGVPSEIVDVVVSLLCRTLFDFGLWSERDKAVPMLLVCEEAHRYVPREAASGFEPTRKAIARIAKEGRKYGVSLGLVTQRPSEISQSILSQCNTLFALRMSNEQDQDFVRRALPESAAGLLEALPALRAQEAVVVGEGVSVPMRVRLKNLRPAELPHGETAKFSKVWLTDDKGKEFVDSGIERWRHQIR